MKLIPHSELIKGNEYMILTKLNETEIFTFQGGINIKLSSNIKSFLIPSDKVYKSEEVEELFISEYSTRGE